MFGQGFNQQPFNGYIPDAVQKDLTQTATAYISNDGATAQTATAAIQVIATKTQSATASISHTFTESQTATAQISHTFTETQAATASISLIDTTTIQATGYIVETFQLTQTATAAIVVSGTTTMGATAFIGTPYGPGEGGGGDYKYDEDTIPSGEIVAAAPPEGSDIYEPAGIDNGDYDVAIIDESNIYEVE